MPFYTLKTQHNGKYTIHGTQSALTYRFIIDYIFAFDGWCNNCPTIYEVNGERIIDLTKHHPCNENPLEIIRGGDYTIRTKKHTDKVDKIAITFYYYAGVNPNERRVEVRRFERFQRDNLKKISTSTTQDFRITMPTCPFLKSFTIGENHWKTRGKDAVYLAERYAFEFKDQGIILPINQGPFISCGTLDDQYDPAQSGLVAEYLTYEVSGSLGSDGESVSTTLDDNVEVLEDSVRFGKFIVQLPRFGFEEYIKLPPGEPFNPSMLSAEQKRKLRDLSLPGIYPIEYIVNNHSNYCTLEQSRYPGIRSRALFTFLGEIASLHSIGNDEYLLNPDEMVCGSQLRCRVPHVNRYNFPGIKEVMNMVRSRLNSSIIISEATNSSLVWTVDTLSLTDEEKELNYQSGELKDKGVLRKDEHGYYTCYHFIDDFDTKARKFIGTLHLNFTITDPYTGSTSTINCPFTIEKTIRATNALEDVSDVGKKFYETIVSTYQSLIDLVERTSPNIPIEDHENSICTTVAEIVDGITDLLETIALSSINLIDDGEGTLYTCRSEQLQVLKELLNQANDLAQTESGTQSQLQVLINNKPYNKNIDVRTMENFHLEIKTTTNNKSTTWFNRSYNIVKCKGLNEISDSIKSEETQQSVEPAETNTISSIERLVTDLNIYPNPNKGQLKIQSIDKPFGNCNLSVMDLTGKVVFTDHLNDIKNRHNVNLSNIENGTYIVRIILADGNSITEKIIIKR